METKNLFELVNKVEDEESFINFINDLREDRMKSLDNERTSDWENHSIETFLEAAHEWAQISKDGLKFYDKPDNTWKRCAQILYMGKIYE